MRKNIVAKLRDIRIESIYSTVRCELLINLFPVMSLEHHSIPARYLRSRDVILPMSVCLHTTGTRNLHDMCQVLVKSKNLSPFVPTYILEKICSMRRKDSF